MDNKSEDIAAELAAQIIDDFAPQEGEYTKAEIIAGLVMAIMRIADGEVSLIDAAVDRLVDCGA